LDKYLSRIGLSGITLFPLLSSFACAIPGIMATRVIKDRRERLITILIAPLMSCSARLPVYVLLIAAFVPDKGYLGGLLGLRGLTMFAMYMVGIVVAVLVAWVLRKTILKTGTSSFVLELPSYKVPSLRNIWQRMFDGGWAFVRDAGTMIVVVTIIVWAAAYFPRNNVASLPVGLANDFELVESKTLELESIENQESEQAIAVEEEISLAQNRLDAHQLENSYLGRAGKSIEPIVKPLGWDWRIGSAAIASFPAREVIVSTMGVIFGLGADTDEESPSLRETLKTATWEGTNKPLFTLPVALSIMVFFALCAQCVSTLAVIRRETNSYRWPIFTFVYMTVLAYIAALATFQVSNYFF
jgi:ferrous iron transport protein B